MNIIIVMLALDGPYIDHNERPISSNIHTYLGSNSKSNIHRASHLLLSFHHETAMVNADVVARYSYFRVT